MNRLFPTVWRCVGFCLLWSLSVFANPDPPSAFPVLSEIQITDTLHWKVEVDASVGGMFYMVRYPSTIDSFFLFCSIDSVSAPIDSMRKPIAGEVFDSKGIAVLTPSHFPGLKLRKGGTVYLAFGHSTFADYRWKALIPSKITSTQSVIGSVEKYCCDYTPGYGCMYCPKAAYSISNTPNIGAPNPRSSVVPRKNFASEAFRVRLLPAKERGRIVVAVSGQAGMTGTIDLIAADGVLVRTLQFACYSPGTYTMRWDGNNGVGRPVPAGIYIGRVKLGKNSVCQGFISW